MSTAHGSWPPSPADVQDDAGALPSWLRRAVESWGVRRDDSSWVAGVLGGVARRYGIDPLLARGGFVALCVVSAGLGLLAYAAAWAVLPDAQGRVQYGRLRRGEWTDATVAIAVIGGIGALNVLVGAGFTLLAPAVGGPGSLLGLAAVAVLVWWLVTRWDADAQQRVTPTATPERGRVRSEPAWYARRRETSAAPASADEHGFHADWIDPDTGAWREQTHSREHRAAARLAEEQARTVAPAFRAPGRRPMRAKGGSHGPGGKPVLGRGAQAVTYLLAAGAALTVLLSMLLGNAVPSATLLPVPPTSAALAVIVVAMTVGLLRGRRPGTLAPVSGVLVGVTAVQMAAHLLFAPLT